MTPQTPKWGLQSATKKQLQVNENIKDYVFKPPVGDLGVMTKHIIKQYLLLMYI